LGSGNKAREAEKRLLKEFPMLKEIARRRPLYFEKLANTVGACAEYGERYIAPVALELDRKLEKEHDYFPWDLVNAALPYRLLSLVIPSMVGGIGGLAVLFALAMEELCSYCAGIANIFGAHALGVSPILVSGSMAHWESVLREVVEEEKRGNPVILAAAVTEPSAGTDVEEPHFLTRAKLSMEAKKVKGGYLLNGRKCFISNGSVAKYTLLCCATDRLRPLETWTTFLVESGMEGFSVPRVEEKMGQRACPAAELSFEDCFVPEENVLAFEGDGMQPGTLLILAASRAPVGAIATGIARGAYEWFLKWAQRERKGKRPIEKQVVQMALAKMRSRIQASRWAYMNAALSFDNSLGKVMRSPVTHSISLLPERVRVSNPWKRFFLSAYGKRLSEFLISASTSLEEVTEALGYASLAKALGGDTAVFVSSLALEVMGLEDCEEREWIEKAYRDAKLTQIYEGTNQLNQLTLYMTQIGGELSVELKRPLFGFSSRRVV